MKKILLFLVVLNGCSKPDETIIVNHKRPMHNVNDKYEVEVNPSSYVLPDNMRVQIISINNKKFIITYKEWESGGCAITPLE